MVPEPRCGGVASQTILRRHSQVPHLNVHSLARSRASAEAAWGAVRNFAAPWHPMVTSMVSETADGSLVRRFSIQGEDTIYRERLTWFSDSEQSMAYTHLEGIEGVDRYDGRLTLSPTEDGGSTIAMSAGITGPLSRAQQVADGTQAVFDAGTAAIVKLAESRPPVSDSATKKASDVPAAVEIEAVTFDSLPRLALSVTPGKGQTLCLFLHGIGGNRTNWAGQLQAVAPYCRAAALDLRGYGDSSLGAEQSTVDDYCADILRVMEVLGVERLVLCGLSFGAWIATSFAMRHPDKLAALVLSGGCTGMSEAGADERNAFRLSREVPMNEGQTPADFAPSVVKAISGPDTTDATRGELIASMQAIPTETYADALRCFTNPLEWLDFTGLTMPVLLMTGKHDRLAPPHEIKSVAERIWDASPQPDVRYEMIVGAGHVCNLDNPDAYNRPLTDLIRRVAP